MIHISPQNSTASCCLVLDSDVAHLSPYRACFWSSSRPQCSWTNMYLSVVFECGFVWHLCSLSWIKVVCIPQQSLTISSSTWVKNSPCLHQGKVKDLPGPACRKGFLVIVHMMVSICKRYTRAVLTSRLPNCMVWSAQMVLKASQKVAEILS